MKNFKMTLSLALTGLGYALGGWDIALKLLLTAIAIDYITGLIAGFINKELSSKVGFKGILKKMIYLCIVAVAVIVDKTVESNGAIRELVIYYFISNECLSVLENATRCGVPVPKTLSQALKSMNNDTGIKLKVEETKEDEKQEKVEEEENGGGK